MSMETDDNGTNIKVISPTAHGVLDYLVIVIFVIAPSLFGLSGVFAYGAYGLAAAHFLLTITTRFASGLFSVLSIRIHGLIELLVALGMIVSPWVFRFASQAGPRNFFLIFGIVLLALGFFTRYRPRAHQPDDDDTQQSSATDEAAENSKQNEASGSNNENQQ